MYYAMSILFIIQRTELSVEVGDLVSILRRGSSVYYSEDGIKRRGWRSREYTVPMQLCLLLRGRS